MKKIMYYVCVRRKKKSLHNYIAKVLNYIYIKQ